LRQQSVDSNLSLTGYVYLERHICERAASAFGFFVAEARSASLGARKISLSARQDDASVAGKLVRVARSGPRKVSRGRYTGTGLRICSR